MKSYKSASGYIRMRGSGGKFRQSTLEDIGVYNGNTECTVYICNVCDREFIPLVHSGICCGVDNKRLKKIEYTDEQKIKMYAIKAIKQKPFINRNDLYEIEKLEREINQLTN